MLLTRCYWVVRCGMNVRIATPPEFEPNPAIVERSRSIAVNQTQVMVTHDPEAAAKGLCTLHRRLGQYGARGTSFFEFNVSTLPD